MRNEYRFARVRYVDIGSVIYLLFDNGLFGTLRPRLTPILVAEKNHTPAPADAASEPASEAGILVTAGCIECHSSVNAPRLAAIVGKPIATQPGVDYSTALLNKKAVWTAENLRAFLRETQGFAARPASAPPSRSIPATNRCEVMFDFAGAIDLRAKL
jgi:hypothetical protein